ncbi:retention module-containing protein [Photobacterium damselae]|uniref:retention module-containing protein n=3 Tax=Photobacterium damselae TaxID=38293 RepID=UPI0030F37C9D
MENLNKVVKIQNGEAFILSASGKIVRVVDKHALTEDEILLLDKNTQAVLVDEFDSESSAFSDDCISCIAVNNNDQIIEQQLPENAQLNLSELLDGNISADEIAAIQNAILSGEDPTQTQEAPAAGIVLAGSAIGRFITIDYDNDSMLAEAGFDTSYDPSSQQSVEEPLAILIAEGGEQISLQVTEGDLSDHSYPVSTSQIITIEAGSLPLDPDSFTFTPSSLASLLNELSSDIRSGDQPVLFIFDSNSNSIVGTQNGQIILTIEIKGVGTHDNNADIEVITTIHAPIDHNSSDSNGVVTSSGDQIHINFDITGADTSGNEIDNPINTDVTIVDGQNPSFGTDSGVTINESTEKGQVIHGEVPLDVGSDAIDSLTFDESQPSLVGLTSNGEPTTVEVNGNSLTVLDAQGQPVLTVTIAKDGSYEVKVTGPLDQGDSESIDLDLNVTATDFDGDSTSGVASITITDGSDAAGGEEIAITITEGDLDTNGAATGNPTTYPVSQLGSFVIAAGEDRLVPSSVQVDPAQTQALLQELSAELTSGSQSLTFTLDSNGNIIGTLPDGTVAITVSLSAVQDGQDIKVTVDIEQNVPLDHTNRGDGDGFVHSQGDNIEISVPVQAQDTDGDALENSANVDITIVDGQNPSFGTDSGVTINESTEKGQVIHGEVPLDVGSDAIDSLTFDESQPSLVGLTSNGEPTSVDVNGNSLTVLDAQGQPVLTVTIGKDGSYEVKVTGPLDQGDSESIDLDLNVTATDFDGDSTSGVANIIITDGSDAAGGEEIAITITEGDLDTNGAATGNPTTYPVSQSGSFVIAAGEDRLVPNSVQVDPAQTQALLQELSAELTSGSQALTFTLDSNGNIVGTLPDGTVAITVSLSAVQDGQDIKVTVDIEQNVPLDHTNRGDSDGFVHSQGDNIEISVPVQAQDTDGDALENSANVDITIVDGQNPSFGTDSGVTINESTEKGQVIYGEVPLDVGSDAIESLTFDVNQPSLAGLTSNGEPTTVEVNGNSLTVLDAQGQPVLTVTIAKDGSYEVKVTGPLDQGDSESIDLDLNVTATDFDGDSTSGVANITITDGSDAAGGEELAITITEGDLDTNGAATGNPTTYPVSQSGSFVIAAGEDRLVPNSVQVDPAQTQALLQELSAELTSGSQALTFTLDSNGNIVGTLPDGTVAITVSLSAVQDGQDIKVTVDIEQNVPLDHTNRGDSDGFVHSQGDNIEISVPVQAQDTDGDALENSANVDITIVDGQNPSFGTDSGVTINESTEKGQVIYGEVPLDVGSDAIESLTFDVNQPSLAGLTSNGEPTTVEVNGNSLTVLDAQGQPVLTVTIAKDGSYEVKVTGPLDQGDSESIDLDLNVTATDFDGDSTSGVANITITDGSDAAGGEELAITITEGDLDTNGAATGNPSTYPVSQSGSFVIAAGEDRLVPSSVQVDPAQTQALLQELSAELTSGSQALTFTLDSNGNIVGTLPDGTVAITVSLSAVQDGQDIKVTVDIEQNVPLDHTNRGDSDGFVHSQGDNIEISVPVQAQDTDGDALENSANVDITIVDGQNPSFGTDSGVTINESTEKGQVIYGEVPLDVGSDAIESLTFDVNQPSLAGLTSNGEPTSVDVNGNSLTVLDSQGQPVLTVTIAKDGSYEVKVTGPLDQGDSESIDLDLNVTATDFDGDSTSGVANITITDGSDAAGGEELAITITEGDLDTNGAATGNPSTYPVSQSGSFVIAAGEDRLVPSSVQVDPAQTQALLQELSAELTSGSQSLTFTLDSNGNIIGTLPDGTVAITVSLSAVQDGQDIKVTVDIEQNVPLDHTNRGDGDGFVHSQGDNIEISVPVQAQDTDGDALENSANVDITIVDGQNPSFGTDSGVTINESTEKGQVIHGEVPLDVGSDAIESLTFDESQPSLAGLTSNGEPTSVDVNGNSLTVLDSQGQPVLTVTIAKDGSYEVKVTGPLDQGDSESIDLDLNVTATDFDGDSTSGVANITITDGSDAAGGEEIAITITEGDLDTNGAATGNPTTYPVSQSGSFVIAAGEDRLVPSSVQVDPAQTQALLQELSAELTSGSQALTFTLDSNGNIVGTLPDGTVAITVSLSAVQDGQDIKVTVDIEQNVPLDHTNRGDSDGFVHSQGNNIEISVPVQAQDTDGDALENSANVDITIVDGQNPSFGTDSGVTINESTEKGQVIHGEVPLDVGSDAIDSLTFDVNQPSLAGLTSNGEPTTVDVNGNSLTVLDAQGQPVLTVTIAKDGSYEVKVTGPLDQGDSESIDLDLSVTATDFDGDSTSGVANITITDGSNAAGGETGTVEVIEPDLVPNDYPVAAKTEITLHAGEDRLDPTSVTLDKTQINTLLNELSTEVTSNGESLTFTYVNGVLTGQLSNGEVALTITLTAIQDGQDVKVTVEVEQSRPLDHNPSGNSEGMVSVSDGNISIDLPIQATDTDGDPLGNAANVTVDIKDGVQPSFGDDTGIEINEETDEGKILTGHISVDVGSDEVASIHFNDNQPHLDGITSNGQPVTVSTHENVLTLVDSQGNTVLEVTINSDGSYSAKITGSLDQDINNIVDLPLDITVTDKDGDSAQGTIEITITDGRDAGGGEDVAITITEGDLDTNSAAMGNPSTYPVSQSGSFVITAGEDRLVPSSVQVDPAQTQALLQELSAELTSGSQALTFTLDSNGNIIGTLPDGTVAITVSLSAVQDGQDVKVTVDIEQNVPLDHTNSGDGDGFVHSQGDNIEISVPVQAQDTDGDALENSANVDITIVDGQNPSFGTDSGVTINESTEKGQVIHGEVPLDVGSDAIDSLTFDESQPSLVGLTSNGEPTTVDVNGNSLTVLDSQGQPVLAVTIGKDGSYEVKVTGPLDQGDSESIDLDLNVTATDFDGDSTSGVANITITDGSDAAGGEEIAITITEGDLDTNGAATDNPSTYPVSQSGSFVITAGEDRLVPSSVQVDPAQTQALLQELSAELTSGSQALTFTLDSNGNIVGTLPDGTVALTVSLSAVQDGQDIKVTVDIEQNVPLDHTNRGDGDGFVHSQGDNIEISVPVQAQDTDGDALENSANVDITIVDGQNPSFGTDSGVTINESTEKGQVIHGEVPLDVGSDAIDSLTFDESQPSLVGLTSNGEPTSVDVNGNSLTVLDAQGQPVLTVTIGKDGSYEVKVTGPLDQGDSESIDLDLNVTATDFDGDSTSGVANITITDGSNAAGGEEIAITITEGDLDTNGAATGDPSTYPVSQSGSFVITAGEDRLVPSSVQVDPAQTQALLQELSAELTSGGQSLNFTLDSNGNIIGTLPDGTVAITVNLSAVQDGQDIKVTVDIEQNMPLDHTNRGDGDGFVHSQGDNIEISVPVQAQDTDGDALENSANVDITIVDGQNPSFGTDSGVTINESTEKGQVIHGEVPLDVGSDAIDSLTFDESQPSLVGLTSNGEPTSVEVNGNSLTVLDAQGQPVLTVTIAKDGSYEVKVTGPLDQGDSESIDLDLNVTATDFDGDSTSGVANITITDGSNAAGGETGTVEVIEPDLVPNDYPVAAKTEITLHAGEDRLDPTSVTLDKTQINTLLNELSTEVTSNGESLTFTYVNGVLTGQLPNGEVALTITLTAIQDGQDVKVTVEVEQSRPLDHNPSGNSEGMVSVSDGNISIDLPIQATDTDGDPLGNAANVTVDIKDGVQPSFGDDTGIEINEEMDEGKILAGHISVDVGSDEVASIHFNDNQPHLDGITSNGQPVTVSTHGNVFTLVDSQGNTVLEVTINSDGSYSAKITGSLDQDINNIVDLPLDITVTDKDGDSAQGTITIKVTDGSNASGGESISIEVVEGDLEPNGAGTGYPVQQTGNLVIIAGEDRLLPESVKIDHTQVDALLNELHQEVTSDGQPIVFTIDSNGSIVGTLPDGTIAITVELNAVQQGLNVNVNVEITQNVPLDHTNTGDSKGFIGSDGDKITINVPIEASDSDGDPLDKPADINITVVDGDNPTFGIDTGTNIKETEGSQTVTGSIDLDLGSDHIAQMNFNTVQPSLADLTSNGQETDYLVSGNQIIVSISEGPHAGEPVLTITINDDGSYSVKQDHPLDQNNADGDSIHLDLGVTATDMDGDKSNEGHIIINIADGQNPTGQNVIANISITEGDLENPAQGKGYPVASNGSFTVDAVNDQLVATSMHVEPNVVNGLLGELNSLTSGGQALSFMIVQDPATGNITIIGVTETGSLPVLNVTLTPHQQANGDVTVDMSIEQSAPLDHLDSDGKYIDVTDGDISIHVPVQMNDSDGDNLDQPVDVTITIEDGQLPSFGDDSSITLNEGDDGIVSGSGQINVDTGSDVIADVYFADNQSSLNELTSNGHATTYTISDDGHTLTVTLAGDPSTVVMTITIDIDGNYVVNQMQPIDQRDDTINDNENIVIDVIAKDDDGDISQPGHIVINSHDGDNAQGGQSGSISITEGDLTPSEGEQGYPVSSSAKIHVESGVDRLDPNTVTIDKGVLATLVSELQRELTSDGQAISFTYDQETGKLVGTVNGDTVLTIDIDAVQSSNGHDVDVTVTITQERPLDHSGDKGDGLVTSDGDKINIEVPIQVQDTDGDNLNNDIVVDVSIADGNNPVIIGADAITVSESALNGDKNHHQGSNPGDKGETAKGQIEVDSGSDHIKDFVIDVDSFNAANKGVLTSGGQQITLVYNAKNDTYIGKADGKNIFTITIDENGNYTFKLKGAIDHQEGTDTDDSLTINIPVQAVDSDGDMSNTVNIPVTIEDDIPSVNNVTLSMEEGHTSPLFDVLTIAGEGADDAQVTALIVDGQRIALDDIPVNGQYHVYEVKDGDIVLGQLMITAEGETYFYANKDLDHDQEEIIKNIGVEVTDGDGDTATGTITIEISDEDAVLKVENSQVHEDAQQHDDANVPSDYYGVDINMSIDVGDQDRGEHIGQVTISAIGTMHGSFFFNGVELPVIDGKVTIPSAAFKDNGDGTFSLDGVTFKPDSDFSTIDGVLDFNVSAEVVNSDGSKHPEMNGSFTVTVDGVADIPTWDDDNSVYHYTVNEDADNVQLDLQAVLNDDDGSENLFYFITITEGEGTLVGKGLVEVSPGVYKIAASDIDTIKVDPADNFSGDIKLDVYAQSEEKDNHDTADSDHKEIIINVNPVADDGVLKVSRIEADEDQRIDLASHIHLTSNDDFDGSEHLYIRISNLPEGAVLFLDGQPVALDPNGYYEIDYDKIGSLQLQPPLDSNVDFTFTVEGVVKDTITVTDENGNPKDLEDVKVIGSGNIDVALTGVVDEPELIPNNPDDWSPLPDNAGLETTIKEDAEGGVKLDFDVVSGEHIIDPATGSTDGSETLSVVISGIPEGVEIKGPDGVPYALVYAGEDENGNPIYQVDLDSLDGITIIPPTNSTEDIHLDVRVVVTENDGASQSFDKDVIIHIEPVVDATNYINHSTGYEDELTPIDWRPNLTDSKEQVTSLTIKDLPADFDLYIDGQFIAHGGSSITLTPEQFALINQGKPLQVKGPEDSDTDLTLHTEVTVTENDVDSSASDSKVVEGTIDVNIISKVEDDGHLGVLVPGTGEGTVIEVDTISSTDKGVIDLSTGDGSQGHIGFVEDDDSSNEVVTQVVLTFPEGLPDGFVVVGGINNGNGSWTVPQSALDGLKIIAPDGYTGSFDLTISAKVQDQGDNGEGDVSSEKIFEDSIKLDFSNNATSSDEEAGEIEINHDYVVTGDEDHLLDLGKQLANVVSVSTDDGQQKFDEFTLVINALSLPHGAVITGMHFDFETGEYVLKVPVGADGSVDLSGVGLILPPDFAGDFELDMRYVTTDTESGDVNTIDDQVTIEVNPIVDIPSNPQTGDHTPDISISVVKTEGLDDNKQPITEGEDQHQYDGIAYEDGDITLDLSVVLADTDTSTNDGLETIDSVTVTVDPSMGYFVDSDGNLVSSLTVSSDQLNNIQFRPAPDFSGEVSVHVKVDITDTADFNQSGNTVTDSGSFETDVSFDVVAVNDEVIWQGTDKVIVGQEDSSISLAGISGSIEDIDGSEQILSIKLTNVPDGFIIDGAVNNGNGVWTISIPPGQTSFNLDSLSITPPKDFSGQVDINVVVYSKEDSLDKPAENSTTISIDVKPVADKIDSDITDHVSGTEDDAIVIDLDIKAYDDTNTTDGSAGNVTENGPETLQITFTNVPDSSSFSLPDGVVGTCEKQPDGSWIIKVDSSELDKVIFHPGDANENNWDGQLNIDVRAVDNGVVADDSIAVKDVIDVDVTPVNDAPVVHVPDALETDEDTKLVITSLQVTDVDASETPDGNITISINVGHGTLSFPNGTDLSGLTVQQDSKGRIVITGNVDDINKVLSDGIEYQPDQDFNGNDTMFVTADDLGNSGDGGPLNDVGRVDIAVTAVNDAPENTVPNEVVAQEDTTTVISGLSVSDPDYSESGSSDSMTVTLSVDHGILDITLPAGSSLVVTGNGSGDLVISGSLDEINKLLDQGVNYTADENYSGSDELTMTTNDGGNVGSGGEQSTTSKVPVTITPKADIPTLSLSDSLPQMSAIRASSGTLIPLLGLIALAADASETLSVELRNLGAGKIVDGHGNPIGQDMGNGVWILTPDQLADAHISDLPDGNNHIEIVAVSTESDGSTAESAPIDIGIVVDNLATSNGQIGGSAPSDEANLVIDSTAEATLIGGAGNDILVGGQSSDILLGGAGNDILWGGYLNGTGDHAKDIFKWERADLGHAGSAAADTIMDFEVGIDVIDLGDALDTSHLASMNDLLHLLQLSEQEGNAVLTLFDNDHNEIQSITLNGVSESDLLGQDPTGMTDEDKLENLLNSGNLQLSNNFGDEHSNTLTADSQGESLFGFDGDDVLVAGSGDDILTGGAGNDLFTWHHDGLNTSSRPDIITDFTLDQDQLDFRDLLHDNSKSQMDDLLSHLDANINDEGKVDLTVTTDDGKEQHVILDNVTAQDLDLSDSASSADIVNQLFSHDAFKIDPSNM